MWIGPSCPDAEELRAVVEGHGTLDNLECLARHLETCSRCAEIADQVPERDDPLVSVLRTAPQRAERTEREAVQRLLGRVRRLATSHYGLLGAAAAAQTPGDGPGLDTPLAAADAPISVAPTYVQLLSETTGNEVRSFGPYQIVRMLGVGGMGAVFLARQARPGRLVALKLILGGAPTPPQRLARFRLEAEVIARLQHPHIVQVYEVGEHDGLPFYTMEYVDGGNLARQLAQAPLSARAAAVLVETLARTMHFAHERGIIHRDLKPSNILLTSSSIPKIGDFGLAKHLEDTASEPGGVRTESGAILGTPSYMAPEQTRGSTAVLAPAVDVYALGAILYEALTGRPPFQAVGVLETLDQVRNQEPVAPSRLNPQVPRDLQTVCLKCLDKEARRRYASAMELADDLHRFLAGQPLRARPVGVVIRSWKWARRQPALAALAAVSCGSLILLVGAALVYQSHLRTTAAQADDNYRAARATLNAMLGRLGDARVSQVPRLKELQRDLLEDALAFYRHALESQTNPDPAVQLDTAVACRRAADIQHMLGRREAAVVNYRQAICLVEGLPARDREALNPQVILADCYRILGMLSERESEHEPFLRTAREILERLVQARPNDPELRNHLATCEHNLGFEYQRTQRPEAERQYLRAIELRGRLVEDFPKVPDYAAAFAEDYVNLALLYALSNRPDQAGTAYKKVKDLLRPLVHDYPDRGEFALSLAAAYVNYSYVLQEGGQIPEALRLLEQAVESSETVLQREPLHFVARARGFEAHGRQAQLHEALGRFADAVKDWDRTVELDDRPDAWKRRVLRAVCLARAGAHIRAMAEARQLETNAELPAEGLYDLACAHAIAVAAAQSDTQLAADERVDCAERYASQAVALLQKLQAQGFFQNAAQRQTLMTDPDLQAIRGRADFRKLQAAVTAAEPG